MYDRTKLEMKICGRKQNKREMAQASSNAVKDFCQCDQACPSMDASGQT